MLLRSLNTFSVPFFLGMLFMCIAFVFVFVLTAPVRQSINKVHVQNLEKICKGELK